MNASIYTQGWYGTAWYSIDPALVQQAWSWLAQRVGSLADSLARSARGGSEADELAWKYPAF